MLSNDDKIYILNDLIMNTEKSKYWAEQKREAEASLVNPDQEVLDSYDAQIEKMTSMVNYFEITKANLA